MLSLLILESPEARKRVTPDLAAGRVSAHQEPLFLLPSTQPLRSTHHSPIADPRFTSDVGSIRSASLGKNQVHDWPYSIPMLQQGTSGLGWLHLSTIIRLFRKIVIPGFWNTKRKYLR